MDILIMGAGAIGSLLAFRLGAAGHAITAVGRERYVRAVRDRGLLVEVDGRAMRAANLRAVESVEGLDDRFDLVLITTKAFDTAVAAVQVQPFVRQGALVAVVQNGVGGIDVASGILGADRLYAGVITTPVEAIKPALIRPLLEKGGLGLAPVTPGQDVEALSTVFTRSHLAVRSCASWQALVWSKLMLNMIGNAIPAILDWPLERVYAHRSLYELERDALCEARAVVRQMGLKLVSLPGYPVGPLVWMLCAAPSWVAHPIFRIAIPAGRGGKRPSLHIDLGRGRVQSEVEFLNGAVVRAGERLGIPTPINRALCEVLTGVARGEVEWYAFQGQAGRLIRRAREGTVTHLTWSGPNHT
ncbi:MAG: ketopantoate reductase family protein [Anaerolineae bacterium]|nr:ketopantoate reductase family protein [Anaerolineae bacterium]